MGAPAVQLLQSPLVKKFLRSVWLFPILLLIPVIILTALRLSGTSVGYYDELFTGTSKPANLIAGTIRPVRGDEWLVNTQMIVAQQANGWRRINPNIADGQDMSVIIDVPYKEWSILLRPQNWPFFVLPLEFAFALKWWGLLFALIVAGYFFTLEFLPRKRLFAAIMGLLIGLNPFVFWWYQTITIAPLTYALLIGVVVMRLLRAKRQRERIWLSLPLGYLLAAFGLVLYPPFQIPCALAVVAVCAGYLFELKRTRPWRELLANLAYIVAAAGVAGVILLVFIKTRSGVISTISQTVYPGKRDVPSGGFSGLQLAGNFLVSQLQSAKSAIHYPANQSEASNFILLAPYLILPSVVALVATLRKHRTIDWPLLLVNTLLVIFLLRMVVPWPNLPYRLLLLNLVPSERIIIGLGLLGLMQLVLLYRHLTKYPVKEIKLLSAVTALPTFAIMLTAGYAIYHRYPGYIVGSATVATLAAVLAASTYLIVRTRLALAGTALLLGVSVFSSFYIMPLYRGLAPLTSSPLVNALKQTPAHSTFAVNDSLVYENFPLLANRHTITGVETYPQLGVWKSLDHSTKAERVYNRYAHIALMVGTERGFKLLGQDHFAVDLPACDPFAETQIDYVLSVDPINSTCLPPVSRSIGGGATLYHEIAAP